MADAWHQHLTLLRTGPGPGRPGRISLVIGGDDRRRGWLLGAYTTFSTFGYETLTLLRTGRTAAAGGYVALSLVGGLAATALGYAAGRAVA